MNQNHVVFPFRSSKKGFPTTIIILLVLFSFFIPLTSPIFDDPASAEQTRDESDRSFVQAYVVGKKQIAMDASTGAGVDFTVRFVSNSTVRRDIRTNTTEYDSTRWKLAMDPTIFKVELGKPVDVTINIKTNHSGTDYYKELQLTLFGDEYNDEGNDTNADTNNVTLKTFVAKRHDPVLSFDSSEENRTVTHKKETTFTFKLTNRGYSQGVPDVMANILDATHDWKARVMPGPEIGVTTLGSLESKSFTVNVTAPNKISSGAYELEIVAAVGGSGYLKETVIAHVQRPDLSVHTVDSNHIIAFINTNVNIRATIQNDGGMAKNVEVNFYLRDVEGNLIPMGKQTIPEMSNYNRTTVSMEWKTIKIVDSRPTENFTIMVEVDESGKISETNEGNNKGEGTLEVRRSTRKKPSFAPPITLMLVVPLLLAVLHVSLYKKTKR